MAKRLLLSLLWIWAVASAQTGWLPAKSNRLVNDYSGVFSLEERERLERRLVAFDDSTSNQVAVVITPTLEGDDEQAVAQRIGQSWGVGTKQLGNGVVILIKSKTTEENWGAVAIATGYGVEGVLPDVFCKRIINDRMVVPLSRGEYFVAVDSALNVILPVLAGEYSYENYRKQNSDTSVWMVLLAMVGMGIMIWLLMRYAKKHGGGGGGHIHTGSGGMFHSPWGGGFGGFGGGQGGGFGGFGGGGFGGGGASGRF